MPAFVPFMLETPGQEAVTALDTMARVNWDVADTMVTNLGIPSQPGAYANWPSYFAAAAILQDQWFPLQIPPVPPSTRVLLQGEDWTDQSAFMTTQVRIPAMLQMQLMNLPMMLSIPTLPIQTHAATLFTAFSMAMIHYMPAFGQCPPGYGPDQVFVRSCDASDPPGTVRMPVPRWCFWLIATFARLMVFYWQSGAITCARRDVAYLYLQLRAALRFRAMNLPDDPQGATYGIPRPDGTWFVPNAAYDGSAGTSPGTYY
jgi:hypothetical protein